MNLFGNEDNLKDLGGIGTKMVEVSDPVSDTSQKVRNTFSQLVGQIQLAIFEK